MSVGYFTLAKQLVIRQHFVGATPLESLAVLASDVVTVFFVR